MKRRLFPAILLSWLSSFMVAAALAAELPTPTVPYSADYVFQFPTGEIFLTEYRDGEKRRIEAVQGNVTQVMIQRRDQNRNYILNYDASAYLEQPFKPSPIFNPEEMAKAGAKLEDLGDEQTADGMSVRHYRALPPESDPPGGSIEFWFTPDGIMQKINVTPPQNLPGWSAEAIRIEPGPQDETLFKIPEGFRKMESPGTNQ